MVRNALKVSAIVVASIVGAALAYLVYAAATLPPPPEPPTSAKYNVFRIDNPGVEKIDGDRRDSRLGWAPYANVHYEVRLKFKKRTPEKTLADVVTEYALGSRGQRLAPEDYGKPEPGRYDIVAVGGSQTMGQGVPAEATFALRVGRALGRSVANLAWQGWGTAQSLVRLRDNLDLQPRIVLYGLWYAHFRRNLLPCINDRVIDCLPRPYVVLPDGAAPRIEWKGDGARARSPRIGTVAALRDLGLPSFVYSGMTNAFFNAVEDVSALVAGPDDTLAWPNKMRAFEFLMREMKNATDAAGACLVVVNIGDYQRNPVRPLAPHARDILKRLGIAHVETAPALQTLVDAGRRRAIVVPHDGHLSAESHGLIADAVVKRIRGGLCAGAPAY